MKRDDDGESDRGNTGGMPSLMKGATKSMSLGKQGT